MTKQASAWIDVHHGPDGMTVGIETDDELVTFDGHFICLFPVAPGEKDLAGAISC